MDNNGNYCRNTKEFLYSSLLTPLWIFALLVRSPILKKTHYNPLHDSIYNNQTIWDVKQHLILGEQNK